VSTLGDAGASVVAAIIAALADHELIKVKLAAERDERRAMAGAIEEGCDCEVVGLIGSIAIVYRQQPDPQKRKIAV